MVVLVVVVVVASVVEVVLVVLVLIVVVVVGIVIIVVASVIVGINPSFSIKKPSRFGYIIASAIDISATSNTLIILSFKNRNLF